MSRQLSHDISVDGISPQIIGIHAGYISQTEISSRAHVHVSNPPGSRERNDIFNLHTASNGNHDIPVTVPLMSYVYDPKIFVSKKKGRSTTNSNRSSRTTKPSSVPSIHQHDIESQTKNPHLIPTTSGAKPRTLNEALASNQFGTSDFRDKCETCLLPMSTCSGHVGHHTFPSAICPATHVNDVVNICQMTCFACSRLLSEELFNLPNLNDTDNEMEKLNIFEIGQLNTRDRGQYDGGIVTQTLHARKLSLWKRFCNKKDRKKFLKQMTQSLTRPSMNAPECKHCGMIQPVELSACRDGSMSIRWDLTHQGMYLWQPKEKFWQTFRKCLFRTFARQNAVSIFKNITIEKINGNENRDVDIPYALYDAFLKVVGNESAPDFIERMINTFLKLHPGEETRETAWLSAVMPFVMHDTQVIENTLKQPFVPATAKRILRYMTPDDLRRIGKGTGPSEHPCNLIFDTYHIPAKFTRPVIKKDSGSALTSTSGVTDTLSVLIRMSTKLRHVCLSQSSRVLSSWKQLLRMNDEEFSLFINNLFDSEGHTYPNNEPESNNIYEGGTSKTSNLNFSLSSFIGGDVRTCRAHLGDDIWRSLSSLNYEVGTALDHRLIKQSMSKPHNSALTGSKNAKNAVRQGSKKMQPSIHAQQHGKKRKDATLLDVDQEDDIDPNPFRTDFSKNIVNAPNSSRSESYEEIIDLTRLVIEDLKGIQCDIFGRFWFDNRKNTLDDSSRAHEAILLSSSRHVQTFGDKDEALRKFDLLFSSQWSIDDGHQKEYTTSDDWTSSEKNDLLWSTCLKIIVQSWLHHPIGHLANNNMSLRGKFKVLVKTTTSDENNTDISVEKRATKTSQKVSSNNVVKTDEDQAIGYTVEESSFDLSSTPSVGLNKAPVLLPQPDQIKTLQFKPAGSAIQKQPNKTLEERIGGKDGLVRNNIITKRVNHSARVVLKPNANISVNCVGIPLRMCLSQTVPIVVTRANQRQIEIKIARSRLWTSLGLYPDLGGVESITTHTGQTIPVFGWPTPTDYLFDDQLFMDNKATKAKALADFETDDHLIKKHGLPQKLRIGWTCELYLDHGDQALISRPPILQRANHNAHFIIPIPGFAMSLNVCCMKGYNADCDGDALMAVFMQSISARTSIRHLMSIENNMICPRSHSVLSSLQLDALLGTCLMISESYPLNGTQRTHLASCLKNISPIRMQLTGSLMGQDSSKNDPRYIYGMLWRCCVPQEGSQNEFNDMQNTLNTLDLFESTLPRDFSYYKILKKSQSNRKDVFDFIENVDEITNCGQSEWTLSLREELLKYAPEHVVVIRYGHWICGEPSSETFGTANDSLVESLWRNYGKYFACDWLSDVSRMAQWYLTEVRGFTCAYEDIVLGGRGDWLVNGDGPGAKKISSVLKYEAERTSLFSEIEAIYKRINTFITEHSGKLRRSVVKEAYEKVEQYANGMILYGANLLQSKNTNILDNNVTTMASTGAKGNATNWANMSVTLGNARNRGGISVGANISPNSRNHPCEMIGERSSKSLGFINRGFCQGLTGIQFFQTSKEARIRTIDSSSPEKSGYIQTQVGVNTQAISVHYDGTVRNQIDEIIQLNYGGDGYNALHVKRLRISGSEIRSIYENVSHIETRAQLLNLLNLVLVSAGDAHARGPSSDFASLETLLQRGVMLTLNVDLPTTFLIHSEHWGNDICTESSSEHDMQCQLFESWCKSLLHFDADLTLMPFDLMLAVRIYMIPQVFAPSARAKIGDWQSLLSSIFYKYTQNMVDPGEAVGPVACQSTNQPTTQLIMKSFKTDVAGVEEKLHISSGLQRITEILSDAESKASTTQISLHPDLVKNSAEAHLVVAMMKGTHLREWVIDTSHGIVVIDMRSYYENNAICNSEDGQYDEETVFYNDLENNDNSNNVRSTISDAYESISSDKKPSHHLLTYFHLRRDIIKCPGVYDFVQCASIHAKSGIDLVDRILRFIKTVWTSCLGNDQFGDIYVQNTNNDFENMDEDIKVDEEVSHVWFKSSDFVEFAAQYFAHFDVWLWFGYRHCEESLSILGMNSPENQGDLINALNNIVNPADSTSLQKENGDDNILSDSNQSTQQRRHHPFDHSEGLIDISNTTDLTPKCVDARIQTWCRIVYDVGCGLPNKLLIFGNTDVGPIIHIKQPVSSDYNGNSLYSTTEDEKSWISSIVREMAEKQPCRYNCDRGSEELLYQPTISKESCWNVTVKCSSLAPFLSNIFVVSEYCYTSNLKEMYRTFGLDTNAHLIALEAGRVLSSDGDVYVQYRHLRLLADVLTSEGRVFGLNQNGLSRRSRSSFIAQSSFEQISENMIKSGLNGRYDTMSHVIPNVVFGKRPPFIGSGICRVVSPHTSHEPSVLHAPIVDDYNLVSVDIDACQYRNIVDIIVSASSVFDKADEGENIPHTV